MSKVQYLKPYPIRADELEKWVHWHERPIFYSSAYRQFFNYSLFLVIEMQINCQLCHELKLFFQ